MLLVAKRRWHKDSERQIVNGLPFTELLLTQISPPQIKNLGGATVYQRTTLLKLIRFIAIEIYPGLQRSRGWRDYLNGTVETEGLIGKRILTDKANGTIQRLGLM